MNRDWNDIADLDEFGRDRQLAEALHTFDPASQDPYYWLRFRSWVLSGAAAELARRRMRAQMTVGEVVHSWARALVPTALLAAAVAGLIMSRGTQQLITVEEMLIDGAPSQASAFMASPPQLFDTRTFSLEAF